MSYTMISARYANADHSAAVVSTVEAATVIISEADTPNEWADLLASGVSISPYVAPDVPSEPTPGQMRAALKYLGKTDAEIDALFTLAEAI